MSDFQKKYMLDDLVRGDVWVEKSTGKKYIYTGYSTFNMYGIPLALFRSVDYEFWDVGISMSSLSKDFEKMCLKIGDKVELIEPPKFEGIVIKMRSSSTSYGWEYLVKLEDPLGEMWFQGYELKVLEDQKSGCECGAEKVVQKSMRNISHATWCPMWKDRRY